MFVFLCRAQLRSLDLSSRWSVCDNSGPGSNNRETRPGENRVLIKTSKKRDLKITDS